VYDSADSPARGVDPDRAEQHERDLGRRVEASRAVHEPDGESDGAEHREQRGQGHAASTERDDAHGAERDEGVVHAQRDARPVELLALDLVDRDLLVGVEQPRSEPRGSSTTTGTRDLWSPRYSRTLWR
jgi:hypothetical protein